VAEIDTETYQMLAFCEETTLPRPSSYYLKTPFKGNIGDNLPTIRDKIKEVGNEMAQDPLKLAEILQLKALCDNIIRSSPKESEAIIFYLSSKSYETEWANLETRKQPPN